MSGPNPYESPAAPGSVESLPVASPWTSRERTLLLATGLGGVSWCGALAACFVAESIAWLGVVVAIVMLASEVDLYVTKGRGARHLANAAWTLSVFSVFGVLSRVGIDVHRIGILSVTAELNLWLGRTLGVWLIPLAFVACAAGFAHRAVEPWETARPNSPS
ncbi:MAG: hypothetical protein QM811_26970 [Pirellulales bacterium]